MPIPDLLSTPAAAGPAPSTDDIQRISRMEVPIVRNLNITQAYCELSKAFSIRTGTTANWCTFATWASKQAGATIRGEDLQRTLEGALKNEPRIKSILSEIVSHAKSLSQVKLEEEIQQSLIARLVKGAATKASDAVARGNRKVFEEIGFEFARFIHTCLANTEYNSESIDGFCQELRPGPPPDGQDYLRRAFQRYYLTFFEPDRKKRQEMQLLSNVEIGFHEQNRLQPEIAESLRAALVDADEVKTFVQERLLANAGIIGKIIYLISVMRGKKSLLNRAIDKLVAEAEKHLRTFITAELMTLTIPPDTSLRLGQDLQLPFPEDLQQISNPELITFLANVDPTTDSLKETGATDWANLQERLHYIADLFRCFHQKKELFEEAFTAQQITAFKAGGIPSGKL